MQTNWLSQDCVYVDKRDPISKIAGWLRGDRNEVPIVRDHGKPYAIIHPRAITAGGWHNDTAIEKIAWPVPILRDGDDASTAAQRFLDSGAPYLPALIGRPPRSSGFLQSGFLLHEAFDNGPSAKDAATTCPALDERADILDALHAFADTNLEALPVTRGRRLVGIVHRNATVPYLQSSQSGHSRQDLASTGPGLRENPIASHIDHRVVTIDENAGFNEVAEVLRDHTEAIVVNGDRFVGSLTPLGVLNAIHAPARSGMPTHFRQPKAMPR